MGRPNWHYDHPPACTCAQCTQPKYRNKSKGPFARAKDILLKLFKEKVK